MDWSFFSDPLARAQVKQGVTDALNRGAIATTLGAPVDMGVTLANLGIAGGGYLAHKAGLVDQPPELIDPRRALLSSEWIGKMQQAGVVSPGRNPNAEMAASLLGALMPAAIQERAPQIAQLINRGAENLSAPSTMPLKGQRGQ